MGKSFHEIDPFLLCAIVTAFAAAPAAAVVYSTGLNGFNPSHSGLAIAPAVEGWRIVAQADFDGNGNGDFAWRNSSTGEVAITLYDGSGAGAMQVFYTEPNQAWKIVGSGDFNGDGRGDLIWRNTNTGVVWVMLMNGATILGQGQAYREANTAWKIVAVGDFSGTGRANELVWRNFSTGEVYQQQITWNAGQFQQTGRMIYREPNLAWEIIGAADFDGDGRDDILYRNRATGVLWLMLMEGAAVKAAGALYSERDNNWRIVAFSDYDGDGLVDLLWRHDLTGEIYLQISPVLDPTVFRVVARDATVLQKVTGTVDYPQGQ